MGLEVLIIHPSCFVFVIFASAIIFTGVVSHQDTPCYLSQEHVIHIIKTFRKVLIWVFIMTYIVGVYWNVYHHFYPWEAS